MQPLKQFDKRIKIGTLVRPIDINKWCKVKSIHETRRWVQIEGYEGSFPVNSIDSFTNNSKKIRNK